MFWCSKFQLTGRNLVTDTREGLLSYENGKWLHRRTGSCHTWAERRFSFMPTFQYFVMKKPIFFLLSLESGDLDLNPTTLPVTGLFCKCHYLWKMVTNNTCQQWRIKWENGKKCIAHNEQCGLKNKMNYILGEKYLFWYNLKEKLAVVIASAERENLRFPIYCLRLPPSHKTRAPHFPLTLWDHQKLNNSVNT